jgi:stage IV sporulation protein B
MFKKVVLKSLGVVFCVAFAMIMYNTRFIDIMTQSNGSYISYEEINELNQEGKFGKFVSTYLSEKQVNVGGEVVRQNTLKFKLFGFLMLKEVAVNVTDAKEVFVGGIPLGFALETKGLIVIGENSVLTSDGDVVTEKSQNFLAGDIITNINSEKIVGIESLKKVMENSKGEEITVTATRKNKEMKIKLKPALDAVSKKYKLGLWVRDDASGVGTLTFVNKNDNAFGALGHPITDYETGAMVPIESGKIYNCTLIGINKGEKGKPGELRCLFLQGKNYKGTVSKNTQSGVFGKIENLQGIVDENLIVDIGSRMSVKPGNAKIVSSVSGVREEYEIEIIKANNQRRQSDKSLVFRVKDKRLLSLTGGILQGMSGSPILQNGKLIGAVTHVFISDPTKGYGIYMDWMLQDSAV